MSLASTFNPTGGTFVSVTVNPASIALPGGTATAVLLTNVSTDDVIYVQLGGSATVVSVNNGLPILPRNSLALAGGTNTYVSYVLTRLNGIAGLNINTGS